MASLVRTLRDPNRWRTTLYTFGLPLVSLVFHAIFLMFLMGFGGYVFFFGVSPHLFWDVPSGMPTGWRLAVIRSYLLAFGALYALVWCGYWWILRALNDGKIRAFPLHVLAAWLPLLAGVYFADPVNNPNAMIPTPVAEITFTMSTALMTTSLFPFYSAVVYWLVLSPSIRRPRKIGRLLGLWFLFAAACLFLEPYFWHLAPLIYEGIAGFPTR